jgi:hypothetical protein
MTCECPTSENQRALSIHCCVRCGKCPACCRCLGCECGICKAAKLDKNQAIAEQMAREVSPEDALMLAAAARKNDELREPLNRREKLLAPVGTAAPSAQGNEKTQ